MRDGKPMTLQDMLHTQSKLQEAFDDRAVSDDPRQSCEYLKDMALATLDEVHELLGEIGWKPWASSKHINTEEARGEWIDAWHFMMNMANKLGMDETMIQTMYYAKAEINLQRIQDGYDGVSTKCPGCKRALDDPAVECYKSKNRSNMPYWCYESQDWLKV